MILPGSLLSFSAFIIRSSRGLRAASVERVSVIVHKRLHYRSFARMNIGRTADIGAGKRS
jgi:hypothetical protein